MHTHLWKWKDAFARVVPGRQQKGLTSGFPCQLQSVKWGCVPALGKMPPALGVVYLAPCVHLHLLHVCGIPIFERFEIFGKNSLVDWDFFFPTIVLEKKVVKWCPI